MFYITFSKKNVIHLIYRRMPCQLTDSAICQMPILILENVSLISFEACIVIVVTLVTYFFAFFG